MVDIEFERDSVVKHNLRRLLGPDGRILICAMDHAILASGPLPGLGDYGKTVRACVTGGADAFLAPIGSCVNFADDFGRAAIIASVETGPRFQANIVERALWAGADAIKCMVYPFTENEWLGQAHVIAADTARLNVPYIIEAVPGGFDGVADHTPDKIAASARLAADAGADLVKTFYTGDPDSMRDIVAYCSVPVVILGGAAKGAMPDLFRDVYDAVVVAGCAGVAIGRNIWQSPDPGAITRGLAAIIHGGATVDEALHEAGLVATA